MDYGTGAIMGVPGHDERDFEFAQKYEIPITRVIDSKDELPYSGQGKLVNSKDFDGLNSDKAFDKVTKRLEKKLVLILRQNQKQLQRKM